jgi:hypothetical protein
METMLATSIPSGVLDFVPAALGRNNGMDWDDVSTFNQYFSAVPACQLLRRRYAFYRADKCLAPDFFYILNQVAFEWLGLFGYRDNQLFPGVRVPLPRAVAERAFRESDYFTALSDAYFQVFCPDLPPVLENSSSVNGYVVNRLGALVSGIVCEEGGSDSGFWRFSYEGKAFEYYHQDREMVMRCVNPPAHLGVWNQGYLYRMISLFFPELWKSRFLENFKFNIGIAS